jgi:hypothetical protein
MNLADKLQSLIARATAITMGTDTTTDASALMSETNPLWGEVSDNAVEMLPVVTEMAKRLAVELKNAPEEVKAMLSAYEERAAEAKFDWVEPPRLVIAFLVLDALERIRTHCEHKAKKR